MKINSSLVGRSVSFAHLCEKRYWNLIQYLLQNDKYEMNNDLYSVQWRTEGGGGGGEIPKALQNSAKLNPIVKTVKNCWI